MDAGREGRSEAGRVGGKAGGGRRGRRQGGERGRVCGERTYLLIAVCDAAWRYIRDITRGVRR